MRTLPGAPYPLGATWDGKGVNFALFSENATGVELCLFDSVSAKKETDRIALTERTNSVWHIYLPDARPGTLYGYRVDGPYEPSWGHRFNRAKLLVDPYAKAMARPMVWDDALFGYPLGHPLSDAIADARDSAHFAPLGRVIDPAFTWGNDRPPRIPWHETIIYETHVKGITALHPDIPQKLRGTYAGLAADPIVTYLKRLGITAVELMPVHSHADEHHLMRKQLSNYWGYNTLGFFAPDDRYGSHTMEVVNEFKMMVGALHAARIEVILDVVYNHTAEGNHLGPTLSFRGIDNLAYYRLVPGDLRHYKDYTGCGNTLNTRHPFVLKMIMDSLRYWVSEMHVDGFRFDLASALARGEDGVDWRGGLLDAIQQDPILSQVKLIAEPWDLGEGGYQVGLFPPLWREWNDKYRDAVRSFWNGRVRQVAALATRISGSSDLYKRGGRGPHASINFVTVHDGFTLSDLVCYNQKHNEANQEENQDGASDNISWNCGVEGPTDRSDVTGLREQQKRNFMATLLLSQGVPLICGGDEIGRTQAGNNNAYCQDNPTSWYNWDLDKDRQAFLRFTQEVVHIFKTHPALRRRRFFQGQPMDGSSMKDITWFSPSGREMTEQEWHAELLRTLGVRLTGDAMDEKDDDGRVLEDDTLLILFNADPHAIPFVLPAHKKETKWVLMLDTAFGGDKKGGPMAKGGRIYDLQGCSLALFRLAKRAIAEALWPARSLRDDPRPSFAKQGMGKGSFHLR